MSIYRYPESKVVDQITFRKTERGGVRAYLQADTAANPQALASIIDALTKEGMQCIPYSIQNKPALEVRGFRREKSLLDSLSKIQAISGLRQLQPDPQEKLSFKEKMRKRSLQMAGYLYTAGDVNFFRYGFLDGSPLDMAAGVFYGLPTPVLWAYGSNDQSEFQIKDLGRKMAEHFQKESDKLPEDCSLHSVLADHKKGLLGNINHFFKRYPSEFMNLSYAAAGACILAAASKHLAAGKPTSAAIEGYFEHLKKNNPGMATKDIAYQMANKTMRLENWLNAGVGVSTVFSGMFGTLVKEKKHDPDQPEKHGLAKAWQWANEKPLAVTGYGLILSTLLHAASTTVAMRGQDAKHKKAIFSRAIFVVSALLAELMVSISSKGHGEGVVSDTSVDDSVLALTADLIMKRPASQQNMLIEHMAKFLGQPDVLAIKDHEAADKLRQQVELLRNNPWAHCMHQASVEVPKLNVPAWQAKIAMPSKKTSEPVIAV